MKYISLFAQVFASMALSLHAAVNISEDFEGTLGDSTTPSGWSFVDVSGNAANSYDAVSGDGSVAGQITANQGTNQITYPSAYVVSDVAMSATSAFSGSFDFQIIDSTGDNNGAKGQFLMGALSDSVATGTRTAGEYAGAFLAKNSFGNKAYLQDGTGANLSGSTNQNLAASNWYSASFSWTPTSGTTGSFNFQTTSGPDIWSVTETYTFDSSEVYFGFGTAGYWSRDGVFQIDNINVTGAAVPEPSSFALIAGFLGLGWVMLRRR